MPKKSLPKKSKQQGLILNLKLTLIIIKKYWQVNTYLFLLYYLSWIPVSTAIFYTSKTLNRLIGEILIYSYGSYLLSMIFINIVIPIIFIFIHHYINRKIKNNFLKKIINTSFVAIPLLLFIILGGFFRPVIFISIIIIIICLVNQIEKNFKFKKAISYFSTLILFSILLLLLFAMMMVPSAKGYAGCGKDFYQSFIRHAKNNNPQLCFNLPNEIQQNASYGKASCYAPGNQSITIESYKSSCLTAFAIYTKDPSHCQHLSDEQKNDCLTSYAAEKNQPEICDLITFESSYTGQDWCRISVRNRNQHP